MELRPDKEIPVEALVALYEAVGWRTYTRDPRRLAAAVRNSTYVASLWEGERLVGLARGLSDDVSIFYLQDVLVHPAWQGQGLGHRLVEHCLQRFVHVRQKVLLTDNQSKQRRFYETLGYRDINEVRDGALAAFVRLEPLQEKEKG
ncbi:MAG: GNAT family N-acetyltransferase [Anaerolineae bacterium]